MKITDNMPKASFDGPPDKQVLEECIAQLRSINGLQSDQLAVTLMLELSMRGYLVYPCSNGGYWIGLNGTLTYVGSTDALEQHAKNLGVLA